jgi:hypothetical protein
MGGGSGQHERALRSSLSSWCLESGQNNKKCRVNLFSRGLPQYGVVEEYCVLGDHSNS